MLSPSMSAGGLRLVSRTATAEELQAVSKSLREAQLAVELSRLVLGFALTETLRAECMYATTVALARSYGLTCSSGTMPLAGPGATVFPGRPR